MNNITKMKSVGTVEVTEVLLGDVLYQRQQDVVANYPTPNEFLNLGTATWFVAIKDSWVFVGEDAQPELEGFWQDMVNPAQESLTYEERQDALCEQLASDNYENHFYG